MLGTLFFGANLLAGVSALLATRLAERIGLVRTMVYTHIPSNILLCLVPLMPNFWLAVAVLLLRACISQMDVPVRESYTMAVVAPDERSAASGITTVARSVGAAVSPLLGRPAHGQPAAVFRPFLCRRRPEDYVRCDSLQDVQGYRGMNLTGQFDPGFSRERFSGMPSS
jgi:predicted MFS family arabinose efflux permease